MCAFKSECTFYSVTHFNFACEKNSLEYYYLFFHLRKWTVAFEQFELKIKKHDEQRDVTSFRFFTLFFFWWLDGFASKMNESNTEIGNRLHTQNTHIQANRRFARIRLHLPWSLFLVLVLTKRCSTNFSLLKPFLSCWNCFYIGRFFCILFS